MHILQNNILSWFTDISLSMGPFRSVCGYVRVSTVYWELSIKSSVLFTFGVHSYYFIYNISLHFVSYLYFDSFNNWVWKYQNSNNVVFYVLFTKNWLLVFVKPTFLSFITSLYTVILSNHIIKCYIHVHEIREYTVPKIDNVTNRLLLPSSITN